MKTVNSILAAFLGVVSVCVLLVTGFFLFQQADLLSCMVGLDVCTTAFLNRTPTEQELTVNSSQLSLAGTTISGITTIATVLLSSTVTLIVSFFIFLSVTTRQLDVFDQNKELARLGALRERERELLELFEEKLAAFPNQVGDARKQETAPASSVELFHDANYPSPELWQNLRSALGEIEWDIYDNAEETNSKSLHRLIEGTNLVLVSKSGLRVSSKVLHETLMWFRNISRAHQAGFVRDDDLRNMWRQILPFTWHRRYAFFTSYFTEQDTLALKEICAYTHALIRTENSETLEKRSIDQEFLDFERRTLINSTKAPSSKLGLILGISAIKDARS